MIIEMQAGTTRDKEIIYPTIILVQCEQCGQVIIEQPLEIDNEELCAICYSERVHTCQVCGNRVEHLRNASDADGEKLIVCKECLKTEFTTCDQCGEYFHNDRILHISSYNDDICPDCAKEQSTACDHCGTLEYLDDMIIDPNGGYLCESCFDSLCYRCESCHEPIWNNDAYLQDNNAYCSECFYETFETCGNCGCTIFREDASYDEDTGETYCEDCYQQNSDRFILPYHSGNLPTWYYNRAETDRRLPLYTGFELEVETQGERDEVAEAVIESAGGKEHGAYCCEDGSLSDKGFEIIWHPMTEAFLKTEGTQRIEMVCRDLSNAGCTGHDNSTCGMHVHLTKSRFTTLHLYKFLRFFYGGNLSRLIYCVSQRKTENDLGRWASMTDTDGCKIAEKAKAEHNNGSMGRYTAVNLTRYTAEIRIFNSSIRPDRVLKNLEFCFCVFAFTKQASLKLADDKQAFLTFVEQNKKQYPNLYKFLVEKNYITE